MADRAEELASDVRLEILAETGKEVALIRAALAAERAESLENTTLILEGLVATFRSMAAAARLVIAD